jgi:predicted N-acetyltransferase YhbS
VLTACRVDAETTSEHRWLGHATRSTRDRVNPVPCLLLGQFATDADWAGQGVGTSLLRHALVRSVLGARLIGGRAVIVHALDAEAADFWRRRGFLPSKDDPLTLFRSIVDIVASLAAAGAQIA